MMDLNLTDAQLEMVQQMVIDRWQGGRIGEGEEMRAWVGLAEQLSEWVGVRLPDELQDLALEMREMLDEEDLTD